MKTLILYATKTGNTKKIAEVLKEQLKTDMLNLESILEPKKQMFWTKNPADLYLLGTGIYADRYNNQITQLCDKYPPPKGTKFALFATWIGRGNSGPDTLDKLKRVLEKNGAVVLSPYFLSYGKQAFFKREHPNETDFKNAKEWAQSLH